MKLASDKSGKRLLDVLDIHWYSEATADHRINVVAAQTDKDRMARMQAPRSLWDSTYAENSWISKWQTPKLPVTNFSDPTPGPIMLLPHIFASIGKYFPGTKLSITEYNYGEANHVTGGIATADYLGIIGRDGVYASSFWQLDEKPTYASSAFRLFRNFDGKNSRFASAATAATASDRENASIYSSINSGGDEVHLIVLNKSMTDAIHGTFNVTSPVKLTQGQVFGFDKTGTALSEKAAIAAVTGNAFTYTLPPLSAYHFVLKTASALPMALRAPLLGTPDPVRGIFQDKSSYLLDGRMLKASQVPLRPAVPFWIY
jgi:mannan endo-1,4-beta-mannosidase